MYTLHKNLIFVIVFLTVTLLITWAYIILALIIAILANSVSAIWASKEHWFNPWLGLLILLGPLVFVTFGLVASRAGLAIGSASIDSLLTISTIVVGLIFFHEWDKISHFQYLGIGCVVLGIIFMQLTSKVGV